MKSFPVRRCQMGSYHSNPIGQSTLEVLCNFFVPQSNVGFPVVNDRSQLRVPAEIRHEFPHAFNALRQVNNFLLFSLVIESTDGIFSGLAENSRKPRLHSCMSE